MHLLRTILNAIFPKRQTALTVESLSISDIDQYYTPINFQTISALAKFSEPAVRACIHETKFHHNEYATSLLARLLASFLHKNQATYLIIPIPLSTKRHWKRGYNQVTNVITKALPRDSRHTLATNLLYRIRDTAKQTSLGRADRKQNMVDAFAVYENRRSGLRGQHILLVDDVTTTGATLEAARAALAALAPASITCLALAH